MSRLVELLLSFLVDLRLIRTMWSSSLVLLMIVTVKRETPSVLYVERQSSFFISFASSRLSPAYKILQKNKKRKDKKQGRKEERNTMEPSSGEQEARREEERKKKARKVKRKDEESSL